MSAASPQRWRPPEWAKLPELQDLRLEVVQNELPSRTVDLSKTRALLVGRQKDLVDVVIDDASVSRQHAAFVNSSTGSYIMDLNSAQGTYLADERVTAVPQLGRRIDASKPVPLEEGQTVRLGASTIVFKIVGLASGLEKWQVPAWCTLPAFAVQLSGGPEGQQIKRDLSSVKGIVIGRSEERTDLAVPDGSVSRLHAAIVHDDDTTYAVDLGSTHGTFVNATRIAPNTYVKLSDGAKLAFGTASFDYTVHINRSQNVNSGPVAKKRKA